MQIYPHKKKKKNVGKKMQVLSFFSFYVFLKKCGKKCKFNLFFFLLRFFYLSFFNLNSNPR